MWRGTHAIVVRPGLVAALFAAAAMPAGANWVAGLQVTGPREVIVAFASGSAFWYGALLTPEERQAIDLAPVQERELVAIARDSLLGRPALFVEGLVGEDTSLYQKAIFVFLVPPGQRPKLLWQVPAREFTVGGDRRHAYDLTSCLFVMDDSTLAYQLFIEPPTGVARERLSRLPSKSGIYRWSRRTGPAGSGGFHFVGPVDPRTRDECEGSPMRDPD